MLSLFWYYELIKAGFYKGGLFIQENYKTFMGLSQNKTEDFSNIQCPAVHEHRIWKWLMSYFTTAP